MLGTFHSIWKFEVAESDTWLTRARQALQVLQAKSGFVGSSIFHSADNPTRYIVHTDWADVGSYRRALGSIEAKLEVWPFLADLVDDDTAFEKLLTMNGESETLFESSVNDGL